MALRSRSMFLYGYQVTEFERALDFRIVSGGDILQATLNVGYYSATSLMTEVKRALEEVDPDHIYDVTMDRTVMSGFENRITIKTDGAFLSLLFGTGPRADTSVASLIGFMNVDYTGATEYIGALTTGTMFSPEMIGYSYRSPEELQTQQGVRTISASGVKEAIVFATMQFVEVQFKYNKAPYLDGLKAFMQWATQQKKFEFTPEMTDPSAFYECTLDKTASSDTGMGYELIEMLGDGLPFHWDTGLMRFRRVIT